MRGEERGEDAHSETSETSETVTVAISAAPALLADALARISRRPHVKVFVITPPGSAAEGAGAPSTVEKERLPDRVDLLVVANTPAPAIPARLAVIIEDSNEQPQGRARRGRRHAGESDPAGAAPTVLLQPDELKQLNGIIDSLVDPTSTLTGE